MKSVGDNTCYTAGHDNQIKRCAMKLPLKEPIFANYLHVDPDNMLHVFMPVVSGTAIGLDNTCKAVYSLQEFFGIGRNSNVQATLKSELLAYQEALHSDLSLLRKGNEQLIQQKQQRLSQINAYLEIIKALEQHPELESLDQGFPSYPRPLEAIMQNRASSNLYSMVLRPTDEDGHLRSEAANPTFRVAHNSIARGIETSASPLQQALFQAYEPLTFEIKNLKSLVLQQASAQLNAFEADFSLEQLIQTLHNTVEALLGVSVDFTITPEGDTISLGFFKDYMGYTPQTTTPEQYIDALLGYCTPVLFDTAIESPFNSLTDAEHWSIATQFLLGFTNIYCVAQEKISPDTNFGHILDSNPALSNNLASMLADAQRGNRSIEEACLSWINAKTKELQLISPLTPDDIKAIQETFAKRYAEIKDSSHFDEFFLLDTEKKGDFIVHQGAICVRDFVNFASSPFFGLPPALTLPLQKVSDNAATLSPEIPHQSPLVRAEVEIDTAAMSPAELQNLYERISTYKDSKLKESLFTQLKEERSDFKPQIDAKQFLQHVAYGEQDEAEALLQDPELAQELLKANNISFTDCSGRTFTCTAYEYAYWAKDTHMQRMLENYIRQDEATRQFIVERVCAIDEKVFPPAGSVFFAPRTPRGLHYTTQDKQGQTINHQEAHFDLNPLKAALQHYIDECSEYEKKPHLSNDDWAVLDKIWIEEVGRAQRDVPAHIAQEYCHPSRSFKDIKYDNTLLDASNPANLKRQLKFYNYDTGNSDLWFTPTGCSVDSGLGFSLAILRAGGASCGGWGANFSGGAAVGVAMDLVALATIDEVRTMDLKQSLENLSRPLPRSHPNRAAFSP